MVEPNLWKTSKEMASTMWFVDAVPLQELAAQHQAQDDNGNTKDAFPVDLAVLEAGILRVRSKYGIIKFIPLSNDDPIVLQQLATDPNLKKALCYQRLHSKYLQEYRKRRDLAKFWDTRCTSV